MPKLEFNEEKHEYTYNGVKIPGVTSTLENVGLSDFSMVPKDKLEAAQNLGNVVHKATEFYDLGRLELSSLDNRILSYLNSWVQFKKDFDVEITEVEKRVVCERLIYAGTLDREVRIKGDYGILDIKTGAKTKSHRIQLTAYKNAAVKDKRKKCNCYTVYLKEAGYNAEMYDPSTYPTDLQVFQAALSIYNYKRRV